MIPNPYLIGGAAIALVMALGAGWLWGYDTGLQKHYEFKSKVEAQHELLAQENRKLAEVSERITLDISNAWSSALAYRERHPLVRVLPRPDCDTTGLRPIPSTPGITPKLPVEEPRFSPGGDVTVAVEECRQRLETAITDAAWIEHVKVWADNQSRIGK